MSNNEAAAPQLRLTITDGPVEIPGITNAAEAGVYQNQCELWDGITATERIPRGQGSANYALILSKPITSRDQLDQSEADLVDAADRLAAAWPFSGGTVLKFRSVSLAERVGASTNRAEVEGALLAQKNLKSVGRSVTMLYESVGGYRHAPLTAASELCRLLALHPCLESAVHYYQKTVCDPGRWFVHAYKVREMLKAQFGPKEAQATAALRITRGEWDAIGRILNNNDLRHAIEPRGGTGLTRREITDAIETLGCWLRVAIETLEHDEQYCACPAAAPGV